MSGFGFGYGFHKSSTVVAGYDADAQAYFDAVPNAFDAARKTIINTLVTTLKTDGNWTELDRLWLYANTTTGNAIIDIKALASVTLVNSPTFTADQGYTGDGATNYVNSNYNTSTDSSNYTQNSASYGCYIRNIAASDGIIMGNNDGAPVYTSRMTVRTLSELFQTRINDVAANFISVSNTNSQGLFTSVRLSSSSVKGYKNDTEIGSHSGTSTTIANNKGYILANNSDGTAASFTPYQASAAFYGSGAITVSTLYSAIQAYMTSLGTQV